jgi:hypothetical protein
LPNQGSHAPGGRAFRRSPFAAIKHAADARINGVKNQGALHAFLTDYSCKWKDRSHFILKDDMIPL